MKCVYCQTELSKEWPFNNCGTCPRAHEAVLGSEFGNEMARKFATDKGRALPLDYTEFAGMLAIAFMLGRQSVDIGSSDTVREVERLRDALKAIARLPMSEAHKGEYHVLAQNALSPGMST